MAQRGTTLTSLRSNNVENEAVGPRGKGAMVPNNRVTRRTAMSEIGNKQGNALQPFGNRTLKNGNFEIIQFLLLAIFNDRFNFSCSLETRD